jgi:hypothetical protein
MGSQGSGNHGDSPREPKGWCLAVRCGSQVAPGVILCGKHAAKLPGDLRAEIDRIDVRGLMTATLNLDVLDRLELVATAIETVARAEGTPTYCGFRRRADLWRSALEARGDRLPPPRAVAAPARQGLLIGDERAAYGPYRPGSDRA